MTLCFLFDRGGTARRDALFVRVMALLEQRGAGVRVVYLDETPLRLDAPDGRLGTAGDLLVHVSDTEQSLSVAVGLELTGRRVLNAGSATLQARDRVLTAAALARAGVPAPPALVAGQPEQLAGALADGPLTLVPGQGDPWTLPVEEATALPAAGVFPNLVLARRLPADGIAPADQRVTRVFAIGDQLVAVRQRPSGPSSQPDSREPCDVLPVVVALARRCGAALQLALFAVDVLNDPGAGPLVLDVDPFPDYRGVPDAPHRLARFLTAAARPVG